MYWINLIDLLQIQLCLITYDPRVPGKVIDLHIDFFYMKMCKFLQLMFNLPLTKLLIYVIL